MASGIRKKVVMVFGTFDGLHAGHRNFLRQAKKHGAHLLAVVAPDRTIIRRKEHPPHYPLKKRMEKITASGLVHTVIQGDARDGSCNVVRRHKPHCIAVGYDQKEMRRALRKFKAIAQLPFSIKTMKPFAPRRYHSRLLTKRKRP